MMPEKTLWAGVLQIALSDFFSVHDRYSAEKRDAISWFESSSREIGSFYFCCDILGLSATAIRKALFCGDFDMLRKRLKSNPSPTRAAVVGLFDPGFEITEGRRVGECSHLRPMM